MCQRGAKELREVFAGRCPSKCSAGKVTGRGYGQGVPRSKRSANRCCRPHARAMMDLALVPGLVTGLREFGQFALIPLRRRLSSASDRRVQAL